MPRTRSIKPTFFTDADLTELSPLHRILFAGLWCAADREGRCEDKPRELKVQILPFDACDLDSMLWDLAEAGFITRYAVGTDHFLAILTFGEHQRPHKDEQARGIPPPGAGSGRARGRTGVQPEATTVQDRLNTPGAGSLVTGAGDGRPQPAAPPPPTTPPRSVKSAASSFDGSDPRAEWEGAFLAVKGKHYAWTRRDEGAMRAIMDLPGATAAEVGLRARRGLQEPRFPKVSTVQELLQHWNAFAADPAKATGPPADVRKGYVRAEDQIHTGEEIPF